MSNGILVVSFSVPVELSIDRLNSAAAGYVSAARRDPDGKGLRIALARKLALHSMQADERLFVDLLPDGWKGPPPPLPQEVVEELARRTREAERRQRQLRLLAQQKQMVVTRVRVAHQPTFSRYEFELPELVSVIAARNGDKLDLQFDAPLKFDLAEAKASLPAMIERIDSETGEQSDDHQVHLHRQSGYPQFPRGQQLHRRRGDVHAVIVRSAPMGQRRLRAESAVRTRRRHRGSGSSGDRSGARPGAMAGAAAGTTALPQGTDPRRRRRHGCESSRQAEGCSHPRPVPPGMPIAGNDIRSRTAA